MYIVSRSRNMVRQDVQQFEMLDAAKQFALNNIDTQFAADKWSTPVTRRQWKQARNVVENYDGSNPDGRSVSLPNGDILSIMRGDGQHDERQHASNNKSSHQCYAVVCLYDDDEKFSDHGVLLHDHHTLVEDMKILCATAMHREDRNLVKYAARKLLTRGEERVLTRMTIDEMMEMLRGFRLRVITCSCVKAHADVITEGYMFNDHSIRVEVNDDIAKELGDD